MLKILKAEPDARDFGKEIGEVFLDNKEVFVQTGKGSLRLLEVQLAGKNKVSSQDFVNGNKDFVGVILKSIR